MSAEARACTGVLGVHPKSRDIKIDMLSITFYGAELIQDAKLELNCGRRYGLIGRKDYAQAGFTVNNAMN